MSDTAAVQVDVTKIVEAHVKSAVTEALLNKPALMADFVTRTLDSVVDDPDRPYSSNKVKRIDLAIRGMLKVACEDAVKGYVETIKPTLCAEIERVLKRDAKTVAKNLAESWIAAMSERGHISFSLKDVRF